VEILNAPELAKASRKHPQAAKWLAAWEKVARTTPWRSLADIRRVYPAADGVALGKGRGRTVITVFNVGGNDFRLLTKISFEQQVLQVLELLTHAEYSKNRWKTRYG